MTTILSLTDSILAAHSALPEKLKTHTCAEDEFSAGRVEQMLVRLQDFVVAYSLDPKSQRLGPLSAFNIDLRAHTELQKLEVILQEWNSDPSTKFAVWALSEVGLTARLAGHFTLNDKGAMIGSLWIEVVN